MRAKNSSTGSTHQRDLRWIDVGCGNGAFTEVLIAKTSPAAVTGIDPSDGQLAYARTRPGTKLAQFQGRRCASASRFADDSFDAATMALVIVFVPDPIKAAKEMARVVQAGRRRRDLYVGFSGRRISAPPDVSRALKSLGMNARGRCRTLTPRAQEAMRAIWQKAGLQAIDTQVIRIPIVYADFDDFWDSNSVPLGTDRQGDQRSCRPKQREQIQSALARALPIGADGRIVYEAFANAVKGRVPAEAGSKRHFTAYCPA